LRLSKPLKSGDTLNVKIIPKYIDPQVYATDKYGSGQIYMNLFESPGSRISYTN